MFVDLYFIEKELKNKKLKEVDDFFGRLWRPYFFRNSPNFYDAIERSLPKLVKSWDRNPKSKKFFSMKYPNIASLLNKDIQTPYDVAQENLLNTLH